MADIRASFATTEDGSGNGVAVRSIVEGDTINTVNSQPALVAKDASNNAKYLKVNSEGELVITDDTNEDVALSDSGLYAANTVEGVVAEITLQNDTDYRKLGFSLNCSKWALFRAIWIDDEGGVGTETELTTFMTDAGDVQDSGELTHIKFTSGSTGVQKLKLVAKNLSSASGQQSDMRGAISIGEKQSQA